MLNTLHSGSHIYVNNYITEKHVKKIEEKEIFFRDLTKQISNPAFTFVHYYVTLSIPIKVNILFECPPTCISYKACVYNYI